MATYFILTTVAENAFDNVTLMGRSIYSQEDTLSLLKAHCKYPVIVTFHNERPAEELAPLKTVLDRLDTVVLHQKKVVHQEIYDGWEQFKMDKNHTKISNDADYYYIDLSWGDFKRVKCDRTAMLQENRNVYEAMSFLFKHGCEFEYDGSRAKLRIPRRHFCNRNLTAYYDHLTVHTCHIESHEEIVEITF